jgi:phage gpG-like protein
VVIRFRVGDGLKYARIHEFGGTIQGKPWLVFPLRARRGKVKGWVKTRQVTMPERPYVKPSIEETAPFVRKALASGLQRLLKERA